MFPPRAGWLFYLPFSQIGSRPVDTFQDSVTLALDTLTVALRPYVHERLEDVFGDEWLDTARSSFKNDRTYGNLPVNIEEWDAHALLSVMWDQWNAVFRKHLSLFERSLVAELRAFRNRWAQVALTTNRLFRQPFIWTAAIVAADDTVLAAASPGRRRKAAIAAAAPTAAAAASPASRSLPHFPLTENPMKRFLREILLFLGLVVSITLAGLAHVFAETGA